MQKSWFLWVIIGAAVVTVLIAFNYQGGDDAVPLSEIFPDEEVYPADVEYEFVQEEIKPVEVIAAAEKSDVTVKNTTPVAEEKVTEPVKSETTRITPAIRPFNYTVQIASFKDEKKAETALRKVRERVDSAFISSHDLGEKGVWHRIYAGQFELRNDAEMALSDIKKDYDDSFIIAPKRAK